MMHQNAWIFLGVQLPRFQIPALTEQPLDVAHSGAVWDIFLREDVTKLTQYLQKHWKEFRHTKNDPVNSVTHPIHDQTFYLNEKHKKQLKDEFNVEPWTCI
ncbi:unnamed protein product [Cuscuta europaea]|uniref:Uncharacterized protein n=1 Tax=Cuscuta europaea TaxID=41803 RepID=A0A9P0ZSS5_CUSEU|nr:unnamed protein product [Cuscuta europaea]